MNLQQIPEDIDSRQLCNLLEEDNADNVEEIKQVIHENLRTDKESWLINALVDSYLETQSPRCLEILCCVREQHDKHLFDKINECLKPASQTKVMALTLLGHIIQQEPPWIYKIVNHPAMSTFLRLLKSENDVIMICNALITLLILLPMVPSLIGNHLPDIFEIFCRLVIWSNKSGNVPDVHLLHLQTSVHQLFLRLYVMYPCNFLSYTRHYVNNHKDKRNIFVDSIKPLLYQVKMHPLLVTASKDYEISTSRWKKCGPHDVLLKCAKLSTYGAATTKEDNMNNMSFQQSLNNAVSTAITSYESCNSQSNPNTTISTNIESLISTSNVSGVTPLTLRRSTSGASSVLNLSSSMTPLIATSVTNNQNALAWNSGVLCDLSTPPLTPHNLSNSLSELNASAIDHLSPNDSPNLEIGVEATCTSTPSENVSFNVSSAEISSLSPQGYVKQTSLMSTPNCSLPSTPQRQKESIFRFPSSSSETSSACKSPKSNRNSPKKDYTTSPSKNQCSPNLPNFTQTETKINCIQTPNRMDQSSKIKATVNRLRFHSQCVSSQIPDSSGMRRQKSCPELKRDDTSDKGSSTNCEVRKLSLPLDSTVTTDSTLKSNPLSLNIQDCSKATSHQINLPATPAQGIFTNSLIGQPQVSSIHQIRSLTSDSMNSFEYHPQIISSHEILDNYLQLGGELHGNDLQLPSTTSVKWTHFGGKPPPDEIDIIRGQNQLLHYQLLFERYKREIHAQRNRRLLGKAKHAKALEEKNLAMKDQLELQEKDILFWKERSNEFQKKAQSESRKISSANDLLLSKLRDSSIRIEDLEFSNSKLKEFLDSEIDGNSKLKNDLKDLNGKYYNIEKELGVALELVNVNTNLKSQIEDLNKELVLMGELHQKYREKFNSFPQNRDEQNIELIKSTSENEIKVLVKKFEDQEIALQAQIARNNDLEEELSNKNLVITEQKKLLERSNMSCLEKVKAIECKYAALRKVCQHLELQVQELNSQLPIPKESGAQKETSSNLPLTNPSKDDTDNYHCEAKENATSEEEIS